MKNCIFTFWEPGNKIPGYIQKCMDTWTKFLPSYKIIILDYSNLEQYLSKIIIRKILEKRMDLAMQSDCIRCAILRQHGGIWIDADTIITNGNIFNKISSTECHMIGRKSDGVLYGAFIYTKAPYTDFINAWFNKLISHVAAYRFCTKFRKLKFLFNKFYNQTRNWDWCVNAIIDKLPKKILPPKFDYTDKDEIGALPEFLSPMAKNIKSVTDKIQLYRDFYFKPGDPDSAIENTQGIILLHNSWTPNEYKNMTKDEFMKSDTMIAKLLEKVLAK